MFTLANSQLQPLTLLSKSNYNLNCEKLDAIIDYVIKPNIPFRHHNDSDSSDHLNKGNFKNLEPMEIHCYRGILQKV